MSGAFLALAPEWSSPTASRFVVLKAPFDGTSTWIKGADRAPAAILDASAHLELYDIETDSEPYRSGIYTHDEEIGASTAEELVRVVEQTTERFLSKEMVPVLLGGEHSVTVGAVRAAGSSYAGLSVLQLDAHTDLRDEYEGSKYSHACVMARVAESCPAVQVGIRSMDASEKQALKKDRVYFAADIVGRSAWMDRVVDQLSDDVYVTLDLDVFDPGVLPATGTPEPGGLGWYECLRLLRKVSHARRIVGFDVVELCPPPAGDPASAFLAAKLVYTVIGYIRSGRTSANGRG